MSYDFDVDDAKFGVQLDGAEFKFTGTVQAVTYYGSSRLKRFGKEYIQQYIEDNNDKFSTIIAGDELMLTFPVLYTNDVELITLRSKELLVAQPSLGETETEPLDFVITADGDGVKFCIDETYFSKPGANKKNARFVFMALEYTNGIRLGHPRHVQELECLPATAGKPAKTKLVRRVYRSVHEMFDTFGDPYSIEADRDGKIHKYYISTSMFQIHTGFGIEMEYCFAGNEAILQLGEFGPHIRGCDGPLFYSAENNDMSVILKYFGKTTPIIRFHIPRETILYSTVNFTRSSPQVEDVGAVNAEIYKLSKNYTNIRTVNIYRTTYIFYSPRPL